MQGLKRFPEDKNEDKVLTEDTEESVQDANDQRCRGRA